MIRTDEFFRGAKVLVTGAAGFVGTNLLAALSRRGADIRAVVHDRLPQIEDSSIKFVRADLTSADDCARVAKSREYVFMCAANTSGAAVIEKTPLAHVTPNVIMNTLMMEAAHRAGARKFLFISSNTVYPDLDHPVEETEMLSGDPYPKYFPVAWMKRFGEILGQAYAEKIPRKMPVVVLRPGNLYGPYDDFQWETSHVLPALMRKVVERHDPLEVWGDGKDVKDFLYIDDFVRGMLLAMPKSKGFVCFNIASGRETVLRDALDIMLEVEGYRNARVVCNTDKPSMIPKRLISIEKARASLGFEPTVSLRDGITNTIQWYRSQRLALHVGAGKELIALQ